MLLVKGRAMMNS